MTLTPRAALGLLAALAISAAGLMPATATTGPTADPAEAPQAVSSSLRIATYNVSAGARIRETVRDLRAITQEAPDVVSLQEMASWDRRQAVRAAFVDCDTCLYDAHMPGPAVPGGTPILYRSDKYTFLDQGSQKVTEDTYVGSRGAGPSTIRAKWVNWVRLRDNATQRQVYVVNNHFVPTVQSSDGGPNDQWRRVAIYRKHMEGLVGIIEGFKKSTGGTIFVTGDFNVNYRTDSIKQAPMFPYHALGAVSVTSSFQNVSVPEEGTHVLASGYSKRLIDYVFNLRRRAVSPVDHHIIFGLNSDHRAMVADFTVWGRGCFQRHQNIC